MNPSDLFGLQAVLDGAEPWAICLGDCVDLMLAMPDDSVDAVVCDPPYGLEFMGKEWDRLGAPEGFRRRDNPEDAGRENVFGRTTRTGPEYTTGAGRKSKPGIGERQIEWPHQQGWNARRCSNCGHLSHGGSPCKCGKGLFVAADDRWNRMQEWHFRWAVEAFRVLKPGGHLIAFGGSRTYHRLACAVEDAGFEIRDQLQWLYGSGFPKSKSMRDIGRPELGTSLKPAHEPIVSARKPLSEPTVAANVLKWGTGALNVDGCRIGLDGEKLPTGSGAPSEGRARTNEGGELRGTGGNQTNTLGRWPANLLLSHSSECVQVGTAPDKYVTNVRLVAGAEKHSDGWGTKPMETGEVEGVREVWACVPGCPVRVLDEQSGSSRSTKGKPRKGRKGAGWGMEHTGTEHADSGGASRFFYIAKANRSEREEGLRGHIACVKCGGVDTTEHPTTHGAENCIRNNHPTVKPIDLMRYLCRLVTPPGGLVLDPFAGSGTTGIAAALESCRFLGFEQEPGYVEIARVRIRHWAEQNMQIELSVGA